MLSVITQKKISDLLVAIAEGELKVQNFINY